MTPEEYQRLKEAEKEHLRKLKELKKTARSLERRSKVARTLGDMVSTSQDALDSQEEMVQKLAQETAMQEARLELALEAQAEREAETTDAQKLAETEEEMAALRAKQLLRQLKQQMGVVSDDASDADAPSTDALADAQRASGPDKTLGPRSQPSSDPAPDADADDTPLPDKTIGRMKP